MSNGTHDAKDALVVKFYSKEEQLLLKLLAGKVELLLGWNKLHKADI